MRIAIPLHSTLQKCLKSPDPNLIIRPYISPLNEASYTGRTSAVKYFDKSHNSTAFPSSTKPSNRFFNNDKSPDFEDKVKSPVKVQKLFDALKKNNFSDIMKLKVSYESRHVNLRDENGNVPLYYAAKNASLDFCKFLILSGARVNEPCEDKDTPMHMACASNQFDLIMLFLENGGSLVLKNEKGVSGLELLNPVNLRKLELLKEEDGKIGENKGGKLEKMFISLKKLAISPNKKKEDLFRSIRIKSDIRQEKVTTNRLDLLNLKGKGIKESEESVIMDPNDFNNNQESIMGKSFNLNISSHNSSSKIIREEDEKRVMFFPKKKKNEENKSGEGIMFRSFRGKGIKNAHDTLEKIPEYNNVQSQELMLRSLEGKGIKEDLVIHSFEPKIHHPINFEKEAGKMKGVLGNQAFEKGSPEIRENGFMNKLKKISIHQTIKP